MSKGLNISVSVATDIRLSAHICVLFDMSITAAMHIQTYVISKWSISESTTTLFMEALSKLPALNFASAHDLVDSFSSQNSNIIDAIAPTKVLTISVKKMPHGAILHQ